MFFRRSLLLNLYKLSDIFILIVSLLFAWFITDHTKTITLEYLLSLHIRLADEIMLLIIVFLWGAVLHSCRFYKSRRLDGHIQEWKDIVKATTIGTVVILVCGQIFSVKVFTGQFLSVFWLSSTILTISFRTILRYSLNQLRIYGRNLRFILMVGANKNSCYFVRKVQEHEEWGYRILGYVDDHKNCHGENIRLLGNLDDFSTILRSQVVDEVVIALPLDSQYERAQQIIKEAEEQGIIIRYIFQLFDTKFTTLKTGTFAGFWILTAASRPYGYGRYLLKRTMDSVVGLAFIILTFPLMLAAAFAIKLTSPGPIYFAQERVGYNKRIFRLYKFRTMVMGAEKEQEKYQILNEMDGPVFKIRNDPRITKVGRWLRKTSIDELPQLFNVIGGSMSLVGPRPLPIRDYNGFTQDWQRKRFSIKPGITCTWQISGRNDISFEDWMKLDLEYIDNWSFIGDLKILFKTIPAVIGGRGAL
ncbi:MAG: sugar transferase [Deltaproteobacteria bacterium]|nr:sugar transferase [Deltaproteobacteria bacterium]